MSVEEKDRVMATEHSENSGDSEHHHANRVQQVHADGKQCEHGDGGTPVLTIEL
jgi:hypothetical protein